MDASAGFFFTEANMNKTNQGRIIKLAEQEWGAKQELNMKTKPTTVKQNNRHEATKVVKHKTYTV